MGVRSRLHFNPQFLDRWSFVEILADVLVALAGIRDANDAIDSQVYKDFSVHVLYNLSNLWMT
jgi:hypothetical protein